MQCASFHLSEIVAAIRLLQMYESQCRPKFKEVRTSIECYAKFTRHIHTFQTVSERTDTRELLHLYEWTLTDSIDSWSNLNGHRQPEECAQNYASSHEHTRSITVVWPNEIVNENDDRPAKCHSQYALSSMRISFH